MRGLPVMSATSRSNAAVTLTPTLSRKQEREQNNQRHAPVKQPSQTPRTHISRSREMHGHERSEVPSLPLMKTLTRGGCPNGEPYGLAVSSAACPRIPARFW